MYKQLEDAMVWNVTAEWTDADWHEELDFWGNEELLSFYIRLDRENPVMYESPQRNAEARRILEHALWAIRSELMERMSGKNWADKWWLQGRRMGR